MNAPKTRTIALLSAAAALALGLSACSGAGDAKGDEKAAAQEEPASEQTVDEACALLIDELEPAIGEMTSLQQAAVEPGAVPDFAGAFTPLQEAIEDASGKISNEKVAKALDPASDTVGQIAELLESIDYSSVDPNAADAMSQYQALNAKALQDAGLSFDDFSNSMTEIDTVCPIPAE